MVFFCDAATVEKIDKVFADAPAPMTGKADVISGDPRNCWPLSSYPRERFGTCKGRCAECSECLRQGWHFHTGTGGRLSGCHKEIDDKNY